MSNIFSITIEGIPSTTVGDLFEEVERLRINEDAAFINIDMNGIVFNANIYETKEQAAATYVGIINGNKELILDCLPSEGDATDIAASLESINKELEKLGFEKFTEEEIDAVYERYEEKQLKKTR